MTLVGRGRWDNEAHVAEAQSKRRRGRPPKNRTQEFDGGDDYVDPKPKPSGVGIAMYEVNTFSDAPRPTLVESFTVIRWDDKTNRKVLDKVGAPDYVSLWEAQLLGFQRDDRGNLLPQSEEWPWDKLKEAKKQTG